MITDRDFARPDPRLAPTFVELLRQRTTLHPDTVAFRYLEDGEVETASLTYAELDRRARSVAHRLLAIGAGGRSVLLLYPPGLDFIVGFFGCLYAGAVAVPAYPPDPSRLARTLPRLQAIAADCAAPAVLTTRLVHGMAEFLFAQAPELARLQWIASDAVTDPAEGWAERPIAAGDLAFLQYTSGSTDTPKGVMLSHQNLLHNQRLIEEAFGLGAGSVVVGWLPLYHDMGLIGNVLQTLYQGITCVLMSPIACLQQPARWLRAISDHRGTISGGPNFAFELCVRRVTEAERAKLDLSSWTLALNGAEPIRAETLARFAATFAACGFDPRAFRPCYGLAEATLIVAGGPPTAEPVIFHADKAALARGVVERGAPAEARSLVGSGRVLGRAAQEIAIVDPVSGHRSGEARVGEIWISGPSVARGYWGAAAASAEMFEGRLPDAPDRRFLRTGDLGFVRDAELYVTGRVKDLIIIRGKNHYPQDIERTVELSHPALRPGGGVAFSVDVEGQSHEELVIVQEIDARRRDEAPGAIERIRRAVAEGHELSPRAILLVAPGTIPKTSSGKLQRSACRASYLDGTLAPIAVSDAPPRETAESSGDPLTDLVARRVRVAPSALRHDVPLVRYALDSMAAIELQHELEIQLGISVSAGALLNGATLGDLRSSVLAAGGSPTPPTPRPELVDVAPASPGQEALWFMAQLAPDGAAYNIGSAAILRGELDPSSLRRAYEKLIARHDSLRITFEGHDGRPRQRLHRAPEVAFELRNAEGEDEVVTRAALTELAHQPFDLATGPLIRLHLVRRAQDEHWVLIVAHHIISDFWSLGILVEDLRTLYVDELRGGAGTLPPRAVRYVDFAHWQRERLAGTAGTRELAYWEAQLAGPLEPLALPTDRPRPPVQTHRGAVEARMLGHDLSGRLRALAHAEGVTPYVTLLAGFQLLLARYSHQRDLLVGTSMAGRTSPELARLVGYLVNPVVIRTRIDDRADFRALLREVKAAVLGAFAHQSMPFSRIVERLAPERDPSRTPIFQAYFVYEKIPVLEDEGLAQFALGIPGVRMSFGPLALESLALAKQVTPFDLTMMVADADGTIGASLQYNTDLFDASTMRRFLDHFERLLESIVEAPARAVGQLSMRGEAERAADRRARASFAADAAPLHRRFERQVAATPQAAALTAVDASLTYAELNARANRIARCLVDAGVRAGDCVGLLFERSAAMVCHLIAILKAGAAYVPLDPAYPPDRLAFMIEDAGVACVVTEGALVDRLAGAARTRALVIGAAELAAAEAHDLPGGSDAGAPAYLLYTSGSTGQPKGTLVTHANVSRLFDATGAWFGFGSEDVWSLFHSISFDFSVWELWGALLHGGRVVVVPYLTSRSPADFHSLLQRERVTVLNQTPSAFTQLVAADAAAPDPLTQLRWIVFGGEALELESLRPWFERYGDRHPTLVNMYGITETTVHVTYRPLRFEDLASRASVIGAPIPDLEIHLLDAHLEPVPVGVAGEIFVGGDGLARGYHRRPGLTAERFIPHPFAARPGERLYRSGDLARRREDGELEYLGRIDHQVKIRGFRVELGEIEAALLRLPSLRGAAVIAADTHDRTGKRLIAYVVPGAGLDEPLDPDALRADLARVLPSYMLPQAFLPLAALPLNANGKLDVRQLPLPEDVVPIARVVEAPVGATEEALAALWRECLKVERVGRDDDFFALGGHSLLATQLVARIRDRMAVDLPLQILFESPVLAELARAIDALAPGPGAVDGADPAFERVPRDGPLPLSFAQERLWFLCQLEPDSPQYNVPGAVRMEGVLDLAALEGALEGLVRRHEALRTSFRQTPDGVVQSIHATASVKLEIVDLSGVPEARRGPAEEEETLAESRRLFDLGTAPLFRVRLLRKSATSHTLLLSLHHIISDGWSMAVMAEELGLLYRGLVVGDRAPLPALELQYVDHAEWQRRWLRGPRLAAQLAYWRERLRGIPALLELPLDRPRPAIQSFDGRQLRKRLSVATSDAVRRFATERGVTPFMVLLAAYQTLLHRYSGESDIVVGSPVANRVRVETERMIGFFVNVLVIRSEVDGRRTFAELLDDVRAHTIAAFAHQDVPFERLVEDLNPERTLSHTPIFQTMFALQNAPPTLLALDALKLEVSETDSGIVKFDLSLEMEETAAGLKATWHYNTALFDGATIDRLASGFEHLLAAALADPDRRIGALPVTDEAGRIELLAALVGPEVARPPEPSLQSMFAAAAERSPEATAVIASDARLSYREVAGRAEAWASKLRALGVGPESRVGMWLERTSDQAVGMLAILMAGGAFVPLDPELPPARVAALLADARASALLTHQALSATLPSPGVPLLCMDGSAGGGVGAGSPPAPAPHPEQLAYVIYTSGSSGEPKGVMVGQRSVYNFVAWTRDAFELPAQPRILQTASVGFDPCVCDTFLAWAHGGACVIVQDRQDPGRVGEAIRQHDAHHWDVNPALLSAVLDAADLRHGSLRHVLCGGDTFPPDLLARLRAGTSAALYNTYGPTEASIGSTAWPCATQSAMTRIPIGRPIDNVRLYILDGSLEPVPRGAVGELFIGGAGVTRGYAGRPAMTAEKFIPDPFSGEPGARLYATGDRARLATSGAVEFLGRSDRQVKILGVRIELGEIEAAIRQFAGVMDCCATVRRDGERAPRVVAYLVVKPGLALDQVELRRWLRDRLPAAMVPAGFVVLAELPMTTSGKVNLARLPAPLDVDDGDRDPVAPRTEIERQVAEIWKSVLKLDAVSVLDDFFELGGHSLVVTQLRSRLEAEFAIKLPLRALFEEPTIAGIAALIEAGGPGIATAASGAAILRPMPSDADLDDLGDADLDGLLAELEPEP